jgi:hypothetical protein
MSEARRISIELDALENGEIPGEVIFEQAGYYLNFTVRAPNGDEYSGAFDLSGFRDGEDNSLQIILDDQSKPRGKTMRVQWLLGMRMEMRETVG